MSLSSTTSINTLTPIENSENGAHSQLKTMKNGQKIDNLAEDLYRSEDLCLLQGTNNVLSSDDGTIQKGLGNARTLISLPGKVNIHQDGFYKLNEHADFAYDCECKRDREINKSEHESTYEDFSGGKNNTTAKRYSQILSALNKNASEESSIYSEDNDHLFDNISNVMFHDNPPEFNDKKRRFDTDLKDTCVKEDSPSSAQSSLRISRISLTSSKSQRAKEDLLGRFSDMSSTTSSNSKVNLSTERPDSLSDLTVKAPVARNRSSHTFAVVDDNDNEDDHEIKKEEETIENVHTINYNDTFCGTSFDEKSGFKMHDHSDIRNSLVLDSNIFKLVTKELKTKNIDNNRVKSNVNTKETNTDCCQDTNQNHANIYCDTSSSSSQQRPPIAKLVYSQENYEATDTEPTSLMTNLQHPKIWLQSLDDIQEVTERSSGVSDFNNDTEIKSGSSAVINFKSLSNKTEQNGNISLFEYNGGIIQGEIIIAASTELNGELTINTSVESNKEPTINSSVESNRGPTINASTEQNGELHITASTDCITVPRDKNDHIKTIRRKDRKIEPTEKKKLGKPLQHHLSSSNSKLYGYNYYSKTLNSSMKSSKCAFHKSQNMMTYKFLGKMKAIDRLLVGPYSEQLSKIYLATRSVKFKNLTKASTSMTIPSINQRNSQYSTFKDVLKSKSAETEHYPVLKRRAKTTISQNGSFNTEYNKFITNNHVTKSNKGEFSGWNTRSKLRKIKSKHNKTNTLDIYLNESSVDAEQDLTATHTTISDTQDFQKYLARYRSPESTGRGHKRAALTKYDTFIMTGKAIGKLYGQNFTKLEKKQRENSNISNTKTPKLEKREEINVDSDDRADKDSMATTVRELSILKERLKTSSPVSTKEDELDYTESLTSRLGGLTNTFIVTPGASLPAAGSAFRNKKEPPEPTRSSAVALSAATTLNETSTFGHEASSLISKVFVNDLRQTFTAEKISYTELASSTRNYSIGLQSSKTTSGDHSIKHYDGAAPATGNVSSRAVSFFGVAPVQTNNTSVESPRQSSRLSLDSECKKSVDDRIRNTTLVIIPNIDDEKRTVQTKDESFIKSAIPLLPLPVAVLCLVLNIILPGSGTSLSGFLILCCGQSRISKKDDRILSTMCVNFMVGLAQLFTVTFLLVGWFWSITWGVQIVLLSVRHRQATTEQGNLVTAADSQSFAMNALASPKTRKAIGA